MTKRFKKMCSPFVMQGLTVLADQGGYNLTTRVCGLLLARSCTTAQYGVFVLGMSLDLLNHRLSLTGLLTLFIMHRLTVSSACLMLCAGSGTAGMLSGFLHLGSRYFRKKLFISDCLKSLRYGSWILGGTLVNILGLSLLPWITLIFNVILFGAGYCCIFGRDNQSLGVLLPGAFVK